MFSQIDQMREQRVGLEHHVHGALVRRDRRHVLTGQQDVAFGRGFKPGQHPHHRGLATARRAQQRKEFLLVDVKRQIVDRGKITKPFGDVLELDQRLCVGIVPRGKDGLCHDLSTLLSGSVFV